VGHEVVENELSMSGSVQLGISMKKKKDKRIKIPCSNIQCLDYLLKNKIKEYLVRS